LKNNLKNFNIFLLSQGSTNSTAEMKKDIPKLNEFDNDDMDMTHMYGADINTKTKDLAGSSSIFDSNDSIDEEKLRMTADDKAEIWLKHKESNVEGRLDDDKGGNTNGLSGATPNPPWKTPVKGYDRHLIADISLVTPTKNSPNTSRDSLLGVELDGLMDGLEWSPMPKKTPARYVFTCDLIT
jgi:hypothetical protein